jgi:hypothetical protein
VSEQEERARRVKGYGDELLKDVAEVRSALDSLK